MKWSRFIAFFIFYFPALIYALYEHECIALHNKVIPEWEKHTECLERFHKLSIDKTQEKHQLLCQALQCCNRALSYCDTILKDIASKPKKKRGTPWWVQMKKRCEQDKNSLSSEINSLKSVIQELEALGKAISLYEQGIKLANLAEEKGHRCQRLFYQIDPVICSLNEVIDLLSRAISMTKEAFELIAPYPSQGQNREALRKVIESYEKLKNQYEQEIKDWPRTAALQKQSVQDQVISLSEDVKLLKEKNLERSSYDLQRQMVYLLERLLEACVDEEKALVEKELSASKLALSFFENRAGENRLTQNSLLLSQEQFRTQEKERKECFYKNDLFVPSLEVIKNEILPRATLLDDQVKQSGHEFTLYAGKFYQFLIQSEAPLSEIQIHVHEEGKLVHTETIALPLKNTRGWEEYLKKGLVFEPGGDLLIKYGLDLKFQFVFDPEAPCSMILAERSEKAHYEFSFSLGKEGPLYKTRFLPPLPWQVAELSTSEPKASISSDQPAITVPPEFATVKAMNRVGLDLEKVDFPVLNRVVEELKKDPLAIASFVQNEITLADPFLHREDGVFYAPSIHRTPLITYLEGQGSHWEQCQLLTYLLKKAGFQTVYALGDSILPKNLVAGLLFTELEPEETEAIVKYPWVMFFDGEKWISLFPWMNEIQIHQGRDLYHLLPSEYSTAARWILAYLKGDENILKHIGPDGDDTAGVLFIRFIEEHLRKQGLSLNDVGVHKFPLKKQFSSLEEFPCPLVTGPIEVSHSLPAHLFAEGQIEIIPRGRTHPLVSLTIPLARLSLGTSSIHFVPGIESKHAFRLQIAGNLLFEPEDLKESEELIDVKVTYRAPAGSSVFSRDQIFSISRGTSAVLCSHFGGSSPKMTSQFYEQFSLEKNEERRCLALLSFVGAAYFEKCSRSEKILADLHKLNPITPFAFGLAKFSPDFKGTEDTSFPQVDMFWFHTPPPSSSTKSTWRLEPFIARMQQEALVTVDSSSNEHQILREIFKDERAISTIKLLQLSHVEMQKHGEKGDGFLTFTAESFHLADTNPELAEFLHFPEFKSLQLRELKASSAGGWNLLKELLDPSNPMSAYSYAYWTPGVVGSNGGSYQEMGALILCPFSQYALISNNNLLSHGGLGSPLPRSYFSPYAIKEWELIPYNNGYTLKVPQELRASFVTSEVNSLPGTTFWSSDVRPEHKSWLSQVADPVDVVTGAFYIDEVDLVLPGIFPLEIRRNYNSQNPLVGQLGCGWKLSLNPFLIEQNGKLYVAEADGTVIAYRFYEATGRFQVFPEDNPDLSNFTQKGIGGGSNPLHAFIENNILYGADGSKRYYQDGLLQKWVNQRGNTLTFSYAEDKLSRIESSSGHFCTFHYNHQGYLSEVYAKDGRRILYEYDSRGDLSKVILPNTAVITYEYDYSHRMIRETKPHGRVLENIYNDQGQVKEQRSPMGSQQTMITTAIFEYEEGKTITTDAKGGKTVYKIFDNQIYQVVDPLGVSTYQSWFIDRTSWFDPMLEQIVPWDQDGGAVKSLKSTTDKRGLVTTYLYDARGNPKSVALAGEDLTGDGAKTIAKRFSYNDLDLCICEEVGNRKTVTSYDDRFPYLPQRIEKYEGSTLISYVTWKYNSQGLVHKEDNTGSITFWEYDSRGFVSKRTQMTGTDDPDVTVTYSYNPQGQCTKITSPQGIEKRDYDVMGNEILRKIISSDGTLLGKTATGYDLNNTPIWKQGANTDNIIYFDVHASGALKATRQNLGSQGTAYTLFEYDSLGNLIEETDPRGVTIYRDYDALGKVVFEEKEGHTTLFSYEIGGLLEGVTSPKGGENKYRYTTNGLIKEEVFPDKTTNSTIYDFWGRPLLERKNNLTWSIEYDDANRCILRTHLETKEQEIQEFDGRGNLIRITDPAGFVLERTYDALDRIKTETTPSGEKTYWSYQGDIVVSTLANGETRKDRYAMGKVIESTVIDKNNVVIASSTFFYDPIEDREEVAHGEEITITWKNGLGLPLKIQKGDVITVFTYDKCGNCIEITDGEGSTTYQRFDGLGRMIEKQLPGGNALRYVYDLDSNLIEYHLPNGNIWRAAYDSMKRKKTEYLCSGAESTQYWEYIYEYGYLKETKDPMGRKHEYDYDSHGRLFRERVDHWSRIFTYNARGLLSSAEQIDSQNASWQESCFYAPHLEHTKVERAYDEDGRLANELIYLNAELIQETKQTWNQSQRILEIGRHRREFSYQNGRLLNLISGKVNLSYSYDLRNRLQTISSPLSHVVIDYHGSGLPKIVETTQPNGAFKEILTWDFSGRLATYSSPFQKKEFGYLPIGYLQYAGDETYDFEQSKGGVCTKGPNRALVENGLDYFGRITKSVIDETLFEVKYNDAGEITHQKEKLFDWDPWGRLLKASCEAFTWEASYDAFGRRIQTRHTPNAEETIKKNSFYDPEEEFQEIGVQTQGKVYWKFYGSVSCDAVSDEVDVLILTHNAIGQLIAAVTPEEIVNVEAFPSSYGPRGEPLIPKDLRSFALSLSWHSKSQDPTGLIWMGARYYDPKSAQFISSDPLGFPVCLDLYAYATGDPVNYIDPDGRFASHAYNSAKPVIIEAFNPFNGFNQVVQGNNVFASYLANNGFTRSNSFQVGSFDLPNGAVGFINGINNLTEESMRSAMQLSQYAGGTKIYGIYNATSWDTNRCVSAAIDVIECGLAHMGFHTPPVQYLKNEWDSFFVRSRPDAKFFQVCHSQGALHVKNALLSSPESVRKRIIVLAIAPAAIIPRKLCFQSYNYASRRDFVTHIDLAGKMRHGTELLILEPHYDANYWDHEFLSPTFSSKVKDHLRDYVEKFGGMQ